MISVHTPINCGNEAALSTVSLPSAKELARRYNYPMEMKDVISRIQDRCAEMGISESRAGKEAGLSLDVVRNMRRAVARGDNPTVQERTLEKLAKALNTTRDWLVNGDETNYGFSESGSRMASKVDVLAALGEKPVDSDKIEAPKETGDIKLAVVGDLIQVSATISGEDIDELIRRLTLAKQMTTPSK